MKKLKNLTIEQHARIHMAFYILALIMALVSYPLTEFGKPHFTLWIAIFFVIAGIAWRIIFIKCPHCGNGLYGSRVIPKFCPNCGKDLNTNPTEGEST